MKNLFGKMNFIYQIEHPPSTTTSAKRNMSRRVSIKIKLKESNTTKMQVHLVTSSIPSFMCTIASYTPWVRQYVK